MASDTPCPACLLDNSFPQAVGRADTPTSNTTGNIPSKLGAGKALGLSLGQLHFGGGAVGRDVWTQLWAQTWVGSFPHLPSFNPGQ